jgi:hypothetical protein
MNYICQIAFAKNSGHVFRKKQSVQLSNGEKPPLVNHGRIDSRAAWIAHKNDRRSVILPRNAFFVSDSEELCNHAGVLRTCE